MHVHACFVLFSFAVWKYSIILYTDIGSLVHIQNTFFWFRIANISSWFLMRSFVKAPKDLRKEKKTWSSEIIILYTSNLCFAVKTKQTNKNILWMKHFLS